MLLKELFLYSILTPVAYADGVSTLMGRINEQVINPLIMVLFSVAFVRFVIGLFTFFHAKSGNGGDESIEQGKRHLMWGIVGMAIMVSVFGIMSFMTNTLGVKNAASHLDGKSGDGDYSSLLK